MNGKLEEMLSFKVWDQALNFILDFYERNLKFLLELCQGTTATAQGTTVIAVVALGHFKTFSVLPT